MKEYRNDETVHMKKRGNNGIALLLVLIIGISAHMHSSTNA